MVELNNSITDVRGILVGHAQDMSAQTGCTVILCPSGAVAGIDQRGGAPGSRETDLLRPMHMIQKAHAILLSGGSAFGLDAAGGVMRYLEERKIGFDTGAAIVPIVPSAVIYDLSVGRADIRPDAVMGYQACMNSTTTRPEEGNVGAGTGATVGKILGMQQAMKSGIGTASLEISEGVIIGALVVINAFGDVIDPQSGKIIAGARSFQSGHMSPSATEYFADTLEVMKSSYSNIIFDFPPATNTCIGVVATNASLTKEEANKVAQMAQNGMSRVIRPFNTMLDGDTLFALATDEKRTNVNIIGAFAAEVIAQACLRAVKTARSTPELPGLAN
jgi:L-aminopeptidase/D-esterase-like protein